MVRKLLFWAHLSAGVTAGFFIFIMAASGVLLSFEKQLTGFADRDIRSVTIPNEAKPRPLHDLLQSVRRSGLGEPTSIILHDEPEAATQFTLGREKTVYVDPYSGAVLGVSSPAARQFFSAVERLHRSLGSPLGKKTVGHWVVAISNLVFGALILLGVVLWIPRRWNWSALRPVLTFRTRLRGKARQWNWHNVIGIWCALPLLIIVLTGLVMSFDWANALLFRLSGSAAPSATGRGGDRGPRNRGRFEMVPEPDFDRMVSAAMTLNPDSRTITVSVIRDANAPMSASVDSGTGGQPQKRTQCVLDRNSGAVVKRTAFEDGTLGQKLRAFVRFGHTGEYGGLAGQALASLASLGACILVYTGMSLAIRRLGAKLNRTRRQVATEAGVYEEQPVG